jgi:hypothetical protein
VGFDGSVGSWGAKPSDLDASTESGSGWGVQTDSIRAASRGAAEVPVAWTRGDECCCLTAMGC